MTRLITLVAILASLGACGRIPFPSIPLPAMPFTDRITPSEPRPFKAKLTAARSAPDFTVSVAQGAANLDAVRESVRFPATNHCLRYFGASQIDWVAAAGDPDAWIGQPTANGQTIYSGRCNPR